MQRALDRHIESTPAVRGGKPRIAGTRITVGDVVVWHLRLGQSLEQVAGKYQLSLAAVYAAMSYYHDHRDAIDQSIRDDEALGRELRAAHPSPLEAKRRAMEVADGQGLERA